MLTIYKDRKDIPQEKEYVELNDLFFNQNTVLKLDEHAKWIVEQIDAAKLLTPFKIESKFNGVVLDVDRLSTGCKTVLNVFYYPEKVFCCKECGDNALEILYQMKCGSIYSEYAMIPLDVENIKVYLGKENKQLTDYEELKEWWKNEK